MADEMAAVVATFAARVASLLGLRAMRTIARVNRAVTNPVARLRASRLPHLAVIAHTGRRSGPTYRTPVMVFVEDHRLSVALNYGVESDWVRNVLAAGSAVVLHRGAPFRLIDPRVVPIGDANLPRRVRVIGSAERSALEGTLVPIQPRQS